MQIKQIISWLRQHFVFITDYFRTLGPCYVSVCVCQNNNLWATWPLTYISDMLIPHLDTIEGPFPAMTDAVDSLKSESEVGKTRYSAVWKNTGGNDTVPISAWRGGGMQPAVYTIQPVVKRVWQPVECLYTQYNLLSNRFDNRFDNMLYRVNGT